MNEINSTRIGLLLEREIDHFFSVAIIWVLAGMLAERNQSSGLEVWRLNLIAGSSVKLELADVRWLWCCSLDKCVGS